MSANFVKRYCAIGWDWHFETDGYSSPVSSVVKDYIESIEAENAKLRELARNLLRVVPRDVSGVVIGAHGEHPTYYSFADAMRELGMEKKL